MTRRLLAVNAVLAGCPDGVLPVITAAVRALTMPEINLRGVPSAEALAELTETLRAHARTREASSERVLGNSSRLVGGGSETTNRTHARQHQVSIAPAITGTATAKPGFFVSRIAFARIFLMMKRS